MPLIKRLLLLATALVVIIFTPASLAASNSPNILVLYPKINPAYDLVFQEIIGGVKNYLGRAPFELPYSASDTHDSVLEYIRKNNIKAVIALGKQTYNFAHGLKNDVVVVHGGMLLTPNGHSGISLMGSPTKFFAHLNALAPNVKRVFTVYNESNSGWIIDLAKKESKKYGFELIAYQASDIREAVKRFRDVVKQARSRDDAIWLLLDNILPDKTVMPMALEAAWQRRVIIFSNNPTHAKRGALFSLFPDHRDMGYSLAELAAQEVKEHPAVNRVVPLTNLKVSLNKRTASHLGLELEEALEEELDVVYPNR